MNERPSRPFDRGYYFVFNNCDIRLIRCTLEDNGFVEVGPKQQNWSLQWSCTSFKSEVYQSLKRFQKVNHFPRSYEITRKNSLYKQLSGMQVLHGKRVGRQPSASR